MRNFMARVMATGIIITTIIGVCLFVYALGWVHCNRLFVTLNLVCTGKDLAVFAIIDLMALIMIGLLVFAGYYLITRPIWSFIYPNCQAFWSEKKGS